MDIETTPTLDYFESAARVDDSVDDSVVDNSVDDSVDDEHEDDPEWRVGGYF